MPERLIGVMGIESECVCECVWSSRYELSEFRCWIEPEAFSVTSGFVRTWFWLESIKVKIEQKL